MQQERYADLVPFVIGLAGYGLAIALDTLLPLGRAPGGGELVALGLLLGTVLAGVLVGRANGPAGGRTLAIAGVSSLFGFLLAMVTVGVVLATRGVVG